MNTNGNDKTSTRRSFLQVLLALPVFSIFAREIRLTRSPDIVEVDGWILKREDLA